jgi:2-oxoglutarate ferredoxin oxidoreductase subunit gamma
MNEMKAVLAGFGGQGILFMGKLLANAGLYDGREVSWLPSYGPEMRGGTCNCSVCVSEEPIGSPLVIHPNVLIAMNQPSYDKFIDAVEPGGLVIIDSTLINPEKTRSDVTVFSVDATRLAEENGMNGMANIVLAGKLIKETSLCSDKGVRKALDKIVPPSKKQLIETNLKAIELGKTL